jgi:L-fuculose-phosphate aldolase
MTLLVEQQIVYTGRLMFERRLTDISGGNISVRMRDAVYITPRFAGSRQHWDLSPEDIVVGPLAGNKLLDHPRISREAGVHLAIYRAYPQAGAIIHAHAYHIQPFAAAEKPIEPVLEGAERFGVIGLARYAPSHSPELSAYVVEGLQEKQANMIENAAALLLPRHGIVVVSKGLATALEALEQIDWNAWCILARKQL